MRWIAAGSKPSKLKRCTCKAMHASDCYWTAERVLDAPETFRVILALDGETLAGYLDITHGMAINEIYDLHVA